jgi:hypothetical protein
MILMLVYALAIAIMLFLVLRRGRDGRPARVPSARRVRLAAAIVLVLQAAFFLLFAVGEMGGDDWSGAGHLLQVAAVVALGVLAWLRPLEGGIALTVVSDLYVAMLIPALTTAMSGAEPGVIGLGPFIMAGPPMLAGILFFIAGMLGRRADPGRQP